MPSKDLVKIAIIIDAHGIKGEVKLRYFSENSDLLEKNKILFDATGKKTFPFKITGKAKNALIVQIDGIKDRNSAEILKNTELYIPASALPKPQDGEIYHSDLIGVEARLESGEKFGTVTAINNFGAGDIVEITAPDGETEMLPLSEQWITEINIEDGYIVVMPAEYL